MAANSHKAEMEIEIGGKTETMRANFDCFARIEGATGRGSLVLARRIATGEISFTEAAIVLTEGLREGSTPDAEVKVVGQHVFDAGLPKLLITLADFVALGLGGADNDKNPQKATKK